MTQRSAAIRAHARRMIRQAEKHERIARQKRGHAARLEERAREVEEVAAKTCACGHHHDQHWADAGVYFPCSDPDCDCRDYRPVRQEVAR
jgi:hypothetical protein